MSFVGLKYFTDRETEILWRRVLLDDPTKEKKKATISKAELKTTLGDWKVYTHVFTTIAGLAPSSTMTSYAPTLVGTFGYDRLKSNAIASIGAWALTVCVVLWGIMADKFQRRGPLVSAGLLLWLAFAIGSLVSSHNGSKEVRLAVLLLGIAFSNVWRK